jgi:hypothetical protein
MSDPSTNRKTALEFLASANSRDAMRGEGAATMALIGVGYSLLDVADAIRERTARQVPLADVEAVLMRVATAPEHVAEHAAPEPE